MPFVVLRGAGGGLRNQRLDFGNQRTGSLQRADGAVARNVARSARKQHFRWVFHLNKPAIGHFKHADFIGGAVTVLDGADDAVGLLTLAFKVEHRVHHVFQNLRTRNTAFLIDMTHHDDRHSLALGFVDERERGFLDLRHASRGGVDRRRIDRLNGVHNDDLGFYAVGFGKDFFDVRFGQDKEIGSAHAQPLGSQLELTARFLARDIEDPPTVTERVADLHQERGFTDTRLARKQDHRAVDQTAAEHAVQFSQSRVLPHIGGNFKIGKADRAVVLRRGDHCNAAV